MNENLEQPEGAQSASSVKAHVNVVGSARDAVISGSREHIAVSVVPEGNRGEYHGSGEPAADQSKYGSA